MTIPTPKGIPITVYVPTEDYERLAGIAQRRGYDRIASMVSGYLKFSLLPAEGEAYRTITKLHGEGKDDGEIATMMNQVRGWVAARRRELGLKPNKASKTGLPR